MSTTQPPWQRPPGSTPAEAPADSPTREPEAPPTEAQPADTAPAVPTQPAPAQATPAAAPPASPGGPAASLPPISAPPPRAPGGSGNTKLIVIVVAVLAVLGLVGAGVVVAGGKDEPAPTPQPAPTGGTEPDEPTPEPNPPSGGGEEGGDLRGLIQDEVGPYTLVKAEQNPDAISAGATDAYQVEYDAGGVPLIHGLLAFNSADEAGSDLEGFFKSLIADQGFESVDEPQPVKTEDGETIGVLVALVNRQKGIEAWLWTNHNLSVSAVGQAGKVEVFYNEISY